MRSPSRTSLKKTGFVLGLCVILLVAMGSNTKFLSPRQATAYNPKSFSAEEYAAKAFPSVAATITKKAVDLTVLAPALAQDLTSAGAKYGVNLGASSFAFAVRTGGTVESLDSDFITLKVSGLPAEVLVYLPLGLAVSGNPIRDAPGIIKYGDFADQTDYQSVANAFKLIIKSEILSKLDLTVIKGKKLSVVGAWTSGGPANTFIIQPVSIQVLP